MSGIAVCFCYHFDEECVASNVEVDGTDAFFAERDNELFIVFQADFTCLAADMEDRWRRCARIQNAAGFW